MIGIGLSMDAFAVAICKSLAIGRFDIKKALVIGAWFGAFQGLMPLLGFLLGSAVSGYISRYAGIVAFILLFFIGFGMIREARKDEDESYGSDVGPSAMLPAALATSIDALAVGISFAFIYGSDWTAIAWPVAVIGIVSMLMSAVGFVGGTYFSRLKRLKPELIGGMILIGIGLKILIEHLTKGI